MADNLYTKHQMPVQSSKDRIHNFEEVALGYSEELAIKEANRCLNCKNPLCVKGCPINIEIPSFIKEVSEGRFDKAYEIISRSSCLPAICGRVCPQESQCEGMCLRGKMPVKDELGNKSFQEPVAIGRLERFVADYHLLHSVEKTIEIKKTGHKVAIIGSGPAGLTCAGELAKKGHDVTIFEALHLPGGVLSYGIPEFRLPKRIVAHEIENLTRLGVKIKTDVVIGKTLLIDELLDEEGFEAIFISTGAGLPRFMNIPGENIKGVFSANEFLTRVNLMKAYEKDSETPLFNSKKVAVVGGGNVAMDACRSVLRLGAEVYCIYRRSKDELPARKEEVEHAREEGVIFNFLTNPVEIIENRDGDFKSNPDYGSVSAIKCIKMKLGEPDQSGRRKPIEIPNSEFLINVDTVIMALGTSPNPLIKKTTADIETDSSGGIKVDDNFETSKPHVFAGGDAVTGSATVILAMDAGKKAAKSIDEYLKTR